MKDTQLIKRIEEVDKINNDLRTVILNIYNKLESKELDDDTKTLLIDVIERLTEKRLELKDININLVKDFLPIGLHRSKILCQYMVERDKMLEENRSIDLKAASYLSTLNEIDESLVKR